MHLNMDKESITEEWHSNLGTLLWQIEVPESQWMDISVRNKSQSKIMSKQGCRFQPSNQDEWKKKNYLVLYLPISSYSITTLWKYILELDKKKKELLQYCWI